VKNNFKFYIALLLVSFSVLKGNGEVNRQEYFFHHIRIEDGLSQSTVQTMIQDRKGYLWFGTFNGLNRFDGYTFKIYSNIPGDSSSLTDNCITALFEDSRGKILAGTVEGNLNCFDRKTGRFKRYDLTGNLNTEISPDEKSFEYPLPFSRNNSKTITSIAEDKLGNLWIGTWGLGLLKFDRKKNHVEQFHYKDCLHSEFNSNRIFRIVVDKKGNVWASTLGSGLYKIVQRKGKTELLNYLHNKNRLFSLSNNRTTALLIDNDENLWIGTYGGGLNKLSFSNQNSNPAEAKFAEYSYNPHNKNSLSGNIITCLIQDKKEKLWIGTYGGGLDWYDIKNNKFTIFKNNPKDENSLSKNEIIALFEDHSSNIWIGTHLGVGLSKLYFKNEKFRFIKKDMINKSGLNDDVVWSICADGDTGLWVGTFKGGLNHWDRKRDVLNYYKASAGSINDNHIRVIVDDGRGNLLIGTYSGGLNIFNKKTKTAKVYKNNPADPTSLSANQVQGIFIDREGNYWIGTFGGGLNYVARKDIDKDSLYFKRYKNDTTNPFSLSDDRVYSIFEDRDGTIWVGTFGGGLNKFNRVNGSFISYKFIPGDKTSLGDNRIMHIMQDSDGTIWIGTYGAGLQSFDKKKEVFTRYSDLSRLKSAVVYCILQDNNNNLWMSTDNGLFKMDILTKQFTQYDQHDGVQSLEFSGGAACKSGRGEMFFGGVSGLNYFYPEKIQDNVIVPPIVISSIKIFNEALKEEKDTITLSYNQNFFSFEFSSLDYTDPSANQYAYMLEGFDKKWRFVDSRMRVASYTNLSPGKYVFSVIGSNNDGTWNYDGANIFVIILPPFWQRWWFIIAVVLLTVALFYYMATLRYRNLLAIERLKSKLSSDLHDNVGSGLTEISILSELAAYEIQNISEQASDKLASISDKARLLIDNMSDIVWMVNPHKDSLHDLIVRLKDSYSDLLNAAGISFKTNNLEKLNSLKLPMEYKQNLFLIFKEAINNAIKHSHCNRIILSAEIEKDILDLSINDNGSGMFGVPINSGNGIVNMKKRAQLIGGEVKIDSSENGTTIIFKGKISGVNKILLLINR
jgi:ligand-binding sensor domain-containing protein/two-component sensor histidine kinase